MNDQDEIPTASVVIWITLILIAATSFWTQATVTEERFVPALNVISKILHIPDDVAGATLMAAGASSPELFSSFISLFITHSALGLGTIVGSEIFNQLIICAGAVYSAKSGKLELSRAILTREVGFYALSIFVLYLALQDTRMDPEDDSGIPHIYISFADACMVFSGYILYVLVCGNMDAILKFLERQTAPVPTTSSSYGSFSTHSRQTSLPLDNMPFLRESSLRNEPAGNFEAVELFRTKTGEKSGRDLNSSASTLSKTSALDQSLEHASTFSDGNSLRRMIFLMNREKPSHERSIYDLEINSFEDRLSCFMWQRSYFYDHARYCTRAWHLRWFSLTANRMISVPDRADFARHQLTYPIFHEIEIDTKRLIIRVMNPVEGKRNFYLMAPSATIFSEVVSKMESMIEVNADIESLPQTVEPGFDFDNADGHLGLMEFPADGSKAEIFFYVILLPLRCLMHYTVPDVRTLDKEGEPAASLGLAFWAIGMCLLWLIVGSYAMVASLERIAALMDIPEAVVGVTVSAAGTSLPNYVASKVAAQNGFGNMAVSNAFGSNTFNIMIGLGLPWVLYTSFGTGFQPYHGLRDEAITQSVFILGTVLLVFVVLVVPTGFVLYKWHGVIFVLMYIAYLAFAVGQVYLS